MKTAIKVFIWIGIFGGLFLVFPVVIGVLALNKLDAIKDKSELQTMGWLTLLFCSTLAGILMLVATNADLGIEEGVVGGEEKRVVKVNTYQHDQTPQKSYQGPINIISMILVVLIAHCFIFAIVPVVQFEGVTWVPLLLCGILLVLSIALLTINFAYNKSQSSALKTFRIIILFVICCLIIALIVVSVLTNCDEWMYTTYYEYYTNSWGNRVLNKVYDREASWALWVVFAFAIIALIGCVMMLIFMLLEKIKPFVQKTRVVEKAGNVREEPVSQIQGLEQELTEVKALFEKEIISKEEYDKIRETIIKKYF